MNNTRRKQIEKIRTEVKVAMERLEEILTEEQAYYYNMPSGFQCSEKGDIAQEATDSLEDAISTLSEAISVLADTSRKWK